MAIIVPNCKLLLRVHCSNRLLWIIRSHAYIRVITAGRSPYGCWTCRLYKKKSDKNYPLCPACISHPTPPLSGYNHILGVAGGYIPKATEIVRNIQVIRKYLRVTVIASVWIRMHLSVCGPVCGPQRLCSQLARNGRFVLRNAAVLMLVGTCLAGFHVHAT